MSKPRWPKRSHIIESVLSVDWESSVISVICALFVAFVVSLFGLSAQVGPDAERIISPSVSMGAPSATNSTPAANNLKSAPGQRSSWIFIAGLSFLLLIPVTSLAYKAHMRRAYDPSLVIHYEDKFDEMTCERSTAAGIVLLYLQKQTWEDILDIKGIEPVLDFFDTLGFYLYGKKLSGRVIHQSFYHWIRLFYQEGHSYVQTQREGPDGELAAWEYVDYLMNEISEIESAKQGCPREALILTGKKYKDYLLEELGADEEHCGDFKKAHPDLFQSP